MICNGEFMKKKVLRFLGIMIFAFASVFSSAFADGNAAGTEVDDIEKQILELQQKKIEALNSQKKVLEAQKAEQDKMQKELEEKQKQLAERERALGEKSQAAKASDAQQIPSDLQAVGRVVYVEAPMVVKQDVKADKKLSGKEAVKQGVNDVTVLPEYSDGALKAFVYKEQKLYQIHCQTFHTTMIALEPGEQLLEVPYISESEVWRLSRGTGLSDGQAVQYLMLKPDKSGLDSTMIIITDRRVYQMQIMSFNDHYMPYVRWTYNDTARQQWVLANAQKVLNGGKDEEKKGPSAIEDIIGEVADVYSFDYEVKATGKTKPVWHPVVVFDDGASTYIILDKKCVNMDMPSVFENTKDVVNKSVKKNVIVINKLVRKLTLKLGNEKVTVRKL